MPVDKYWEFWSRRQESNLYPTLRRHVHYPLCYGEQELFKSMLGKFVTSIHYHPHKAHT